MDEAGKLIAELQEKLAQLDLKVWLYRQDMAAEFRKHADGLLQDKPKEVSERVMESINESMERYPSLHRSCLEADQPGPQSAESCATSQKTSENSVTSDTNTTAADPILPAMAYRGPESTMEDSQSLHDRERELQGLFTPSYLPLLDTTDCNERRSSSSAHSRSASESPPITMMSRERAADDAGATPSSDPSSSSLSLRKLATPRRRNTDEASIYSDQSDAPVRRSALRRSPGPAKPQSPRHVRFEFAGEEFPTTSSPKMDTPELETAKKIAIILGNGEDFYGEAGSQHVEDVKESPPAKKISSSQALRTLSRGPLEEDGTIWTKVSAPPDESPSVSNAELDKDALRDVMFGGELLPSTSIQASKSNGHKARGLDEGYILESDAFKPLSGNVPQPTDAHSLSRNGDDTSADPTGEEADILADMPPLQTMKSRKPINVVSGATLDSIYGARSQAAATKPPGKQFFTFPDTTDLNDLIEDTAKLQIEDDDELFAFDETAERTALKPEPEPESDPNSDSASETAEDPIALSHFATSPPRAIPQPRSAPKPASDPSNPISSVTTGRPTSVRRSSYHPFNTPIVSEAIHAQAASLGDINTFVGSIKDGLDETALQSFVASIRAGMGGAGGGEGGGGQPRSLSEKMAFDDAMERRREEEAGRRK